MGRHGHRGNYEIKNIEITISKSSVIIEDRCLKEYYSKEEKEKRKIRFEQKKKHIEQMSCEEYSSTTLTSLQGFVYYMHDYYDDFSCDYGFNNENNFKITINFGKDEK